MSKYKSRYSVHLFYSYSHKDSRYREGMEKSLSLLRRNKLLTTWSDVSIIPGQPISAKIRQEMDRANIMVFLLSHNYFDSDPCMDEWDIAKARSTTDLLLRILVILTDCPWRDFLDDDDIKALPTDGHPVDLCDSESKAWTEIYDGIKRAVNALRNTFDPKSEFVREISKTYFVGRDPIVLRDVFVFPKLSSYTSRRPDATMTERILSNRKDLTNEKQVLIHGSELSGKTTIARYLVLSLLDESSPVLLVDLNEIGSRSIDRILTETYYRQFSGDYDLWKQQPNKTLILDNLSSAGPSIEFLAGAVEQFDTMVVTCASDVFHSFLADDERLVNFISVAILPLTHVQQEDLIRKRMLLADKSDSVTDGRIDQLETDVNSIITSRRIVPRYPFFVLSILQTYETFLPDMQVTSYGYCYYVLIVTNLVKAGIPRTDDGIGASFNFAERLAFELQQTREAPGAFDFQAFVAEYRNRFIIPDAILSRLQHPEFGIISPDGRFRARYMYYYFVGLFLSRNTQAYRSLIEEMCDNVHRGRNYLTLLFIIHHTNEVWIVEEILIRIMCSFDSVRPATLSKQETVRFDEIVDDLSENILSDRDVSAERRDIRGIRDAGDGHDVGDTLEQDGDTDSFGSRCYRMLRSNGILGQVLRNKYGILERSRVEEIIETIADASLRVVNARLKDEAEIEHKARYLHRKYPKYELDDLRMVLRWLSFVWTIINIGLAVESIYHPDVRDILDKIVKRKSTPAYDLIGYISRLQGAPELTAGVKDVLKRLLDRHDDRFIRSLLSLSTQQYMNTHHSKASVEQSICSLLGLHYISR